MPDPILIVDDESVLRRNIVRFLQRAGLETTGVASAEEALTLMQEQSFSLVLTDLNMPGMGGLGLLKALAQRAPTTPLMIMTAYASVDSAVQALRSGAQDYLLKPVSLVELETKIRRLLEHQALQDRHLRLRQELHQHYDLPGMVADSPVMQPIKRMIQRVGPTQSTVLIEGESGTGKELIARALHEAGDEERELIAVNLAALPPDLVDATLFGHERGAFTGATSARKGVFRAADGGTVFLDEVGELPASVQVKLLRVLESREVFPLGASRSVPVRFRLITATNRSLKQQVEQGHFREDLFFRLNVITLRLPPLRERREDLTLLAQHFLRRHAATLGLPTPTLSSEAQRHLQSYRWPGNVRELSNAMERAVLLCDGTLTPADLPQSAGDKPMELKAALAAFEREHIKRVINQVDGDKARAAELLDIHLSTLYRRMGK